MVQDAQAQREDALQRSGREKGQIVPEYARKHRPVQLLQGFLAVCPIGVDPKTHDAERHLRHQLQLRALFDVLRGLLRQIHALQYRLAEAGHPEGLHGHPDLERARRAAQLQPAVREIRVVRSPYGVLQHVVTECEGAFQAFDVLYHEHRSLVRLKEPLVRVQAHRVRQLDTVEQALAPLGYQDESAVGGIHM